jgi:hypothetical protein
MFLNYVKYILPFFSSRLVSPKKYINPPSVIIFPSLLITGLVVSSHQKTMLAPGIALSKIDDS